MARIVSLSVLIAAITGLGIMFFQVVAPFLLPLFLAAVASVILTPWFKDIRRRLKGRNRMAAGVTTVLVMLLILLPVSLGILLAGIQAYSFSVKLTPAELRETQDKTTDWLANSIVRNESWIPDLLAAPSPDEIDRKLEENRILDEDLADLLETGELSLEDREEVRGKRYQLTTANARLSRLAQDGAAADGSENAEVAYYRSLISEKAQELRHLVNWQLVGVASKTVGGTLGIVGQTVGLILGGVITFFIFAVALYYFLADGPALIEGTYRLIPVQQDYQRELFEEFGKVVRSVVLATFLAATAQGIATTFALALCGFDHLILLLIVAIVASLIPLAGTWLVWVPCAVVLVAKGQYFAAFMLSAWGSIVVGTMDNVIRAYVLNNDTKLHPLLALLAVLGGLQVMGIWGVFIGPIIASCLHALVKIFNHELLELSQERFGELPKQKAPETDDPNETDRLLNSTEQAVKQIREGELGTTDKVDVDSANAGSTASEDDTTSSGAKKS